MKYQLFALEVGFAALSALRTEARKKPNIAADDPGYGYLSCFGQEKFQMPSQTLIGWL